MGEALRGSNAAWHFEAGEFTVHYRKRLGSSWLLDVLGERRVPYAALASVDVLPGRRGTVVLRAVPRPGADALMDAAAGQLKESADPYRLVLPADRQTLAEYYADEIRAAITASGRAGLPSDDWLVAAPPVPRQFKGYDGKVAFDGRHVALHWFWSGASTAKLDAGDQLLAVERIAGVDWRSPELFNGYLRFRVHGEPVHPDPEKDPYAVTFGLGTGAVADSLPLAAAVLQASRTARPAAPVPPALTPPPGAPELAAAPDRTTPEHAAERLRRLAALHAEGLLTDAEFAAKKAELLRDL